ncbi:MAG TPA: methyl-accepting chemotaxis protein [Rhodocyclaceae bacterium]|nr:methyl-accepting chemotaxis protein [Rhodocyclaceae bacterium]
MNIRVKLRIVTTFTLIGLSSITAATLWGLQTIQAAHDTAERRSLSVEELLEIKVSAVSTILLDPSQQDTKDIFNAAGKSITERGPRILGTIKREALRNELKGILDQWDSYNNASLQLIKQAATDPKGANEEVRPLYEKTFQPLYERLEKFITQRHADAQLASSEASTVSSRVFWLNTSLVITIAIINLLVVLSVSRSLQSSLNGILEHLKPLSQGDLTQRLPDRGRDELDAIAASVNNFVGELQAIVQRTRNRSANLAVAAVQLSSSATNVLESANHQSDATSSAAASVEEFSVGIDQVADNAARAEQQASESGELSRKGGSDVQSAIAEVQRIEDAVGEASRQMAVLGQQAQDIGNIVNVIKEVADQTNLLALNAAIEAARAGEQGRGFAVVADEVRKLAERTASSAQEITDMVNTVQQSTENASAVMLQGNALVAQSVHQIQSTGESMQRINESSSGVVGSVVEISAALREQRLAGAEIARNIERIAQMTEGGRTSAAEISGATQQLERLAQELQSEVAHFRA